MNLLWCFLSVLLTPSVNSQDELSYNGYKILEIGNLEFIKNSHELLKLFQLGGETQILHQNKREGTVQLLLSPEDSDKVIGVAKDRFPYKTLEDDLGLKLESLMRSIMERKNLRTSSAQLDFTTYPTYSEIESYLKSLKKDHKGKVEVKSIGKTSEGRDIWMVRISDKLSDRNRPVIFIESGIHAREWITPISALYGIHQLISSPEYSNVEWRIVPVLNADGYSFSWTGNNRMWRKNRVKLDSKWCQGVDLNRNFDAAFQGNSKHFCWETYPGEYAFSEQESKAVKRQILSLKGRVKAYLAVHNYGQVILYAPGYEMQPLSNITKSKAAADKMVVRLKDELRIIYEAGSLFDLLYEAKGTSPDWAFFKEKIPISMAIELRDKGFYGFLLPEYLVPKSVKDLWVAMKVLHEEVTKLPNIFRSSIDPSGPPNKMEVYPEDLSSSSEEDIQDGDSEEQEGQSFSFEEP